VLGVAIVVPGFGLGVRFGGRGNGFGGALLRSSRGDLALGSFVSRIVKSRKWIRRLFVSFSFHFILDTADGSIAVEQRQ
jgi:hypothetical protein